MKKTIIILAALAAACACQKTASPAVEGETIILTAGAGVDETKVHFGEFSQNKYPYVWDDAEVVGLSEFCGTAKSQEVASTSYTKVSANKAKFEFNLAAKTTEGTYFYAAVIPANSAKNSNHGWRGYDVGKFSYILNHTLSQTPLADGPDPTTNIMYATYEAGTAQPQSTIQLNFQPAVAYGKMTLKNMPALESGETVTSITITAPNDKFMRGRVKKNISTGEEEFFGAATKANNVVIDPQNIEYNTTGFAVWFTTLPFALAKDDILNVKVITSKNLYQGGIKLSKAIEFKKGEVSGFVFDYSKATMLTLTFDFSKCPEGWPSGQDEYKRTVYTEEPHTYTLDGKEYVFSTSACTNCGTTRSIAWGYDGTTTVKYLVAQSHRFFGLPAIQGYKLVTVKFTQALADKTRKACITSEITASSQQAAKSVSGEATTVSPGGAEYTLNLTTSSANTRYYFAPCSNGSGFATMTLIYEKAN